MPVRKLFAYAAIYILWGGSFLAIRELVAPPHGIAPVPPFLAAGFRFTLAGLFLILWSRAAGTTSLSLRQFRSATLLGFIMFACLYAPLFWAETRVASGLASVISAMIPVWIFAGELFVLRTQRASALAVGGIALGFAGVVVLSLRAPGSAGSSSTLAILGTVAGTLCWSAGTLLSRRLALPQPQRANAGWQMLTGGAMLLMISGVAGEPRRIPPAAVLLSPRVVASMAYLIVAASIIAYTAYVWLIAHESPTRVSSYAYVNPVIALAIGSMLAGERLTLLQIAGAVLVLAGVFATLRSRAVAQPAPSLPARAAS
ncbi:MAG TPA: EamA family transporter [Acidobacteriaceae bacterium]|nr:EamA family transporter [Acidobacteriaceae bacterium]